jgi:Sel1 repeat
MSRGASLQLQADEDHTAGERWARPPSNFSVVPPCARSPRCAAASRAVVHKETFRPTSDIGNGPAVLWPRWDERLARGAQDKEHAMSQKINAAIAAIVLVSAFAAPVAAGTFEDAVDAHARGDYAKGLRLIRPLANDGNATAQFNLGVMYLTGRGVQQDYSAAALWFRKAAAQGYAFAQSNLGTLYRDGRGVAQDDTEAVMWFRKAADQGDAVAELLLGNQYANGKGVPQHYSEAMIWFQRAAEQGHPVAKLYLGVMYAEGRGVPQDYVRAHMWFSLAVAQGEHRAITTLKMVESRPANRGRLSLSSLRARNQAVDCDDTTTFMRKLSTIDAGCNQAR